MLLAVAGPLLVGALQLVVARKQPRLGEWIGIAATGALALLAWRLVEFAAGGATSVYLLGNWRAPFGIVLVLDRLSAMMVLLTAIVALGSLLASGTVARRGPYFQTFFQVQLAGLNGAFLTGDLFNLFVFFEVLLTASYALLLHGAPARALRAGLHFVVINLVGSALFLVAVSLLYGVTGTLNMADLAVRLAELPVADAGLARAAAMLLLVVFALKAAVLPLGFWLPETYGAAPAPVAALFAVMTKVGVYGIVRMSMLAFGADAGMLQGWGATALLAAGLSTAAFGALFALAATRLTSLVGSVMLISSGTLVAATTLGPPVLGGALYYLVHSTLVAALAFLIAGAIGGQRGDWGDRFGAGPPVARPALLGGLFLLTGAAIAGLPPFGGFIGKALMLAGTAGTAATAWFWPGLLGSGLVAIFCFARAGTRIFWKTTGPALASASTPMVTSGMALLAAASVAWLILAAPAIRYASDAAAQLAQPRAYVDAVRSRAPVPPPGKGMP